MISASRVIARLQSGDRGLADTKTKIWRLRRLVAGDTDALNDGMSPGSNQDLGAGEARLYRNNFPSILVQEIQEGKNNALLKFIQVLVWQTTYFFPKVELQGITPHEQVVNAQYLKYRMREYPFGCSAAHHMRIALMDYAMGGLGVVYLPMQKGKPVARWADSLDLKWDQAAQLVTDIRWMSVTVCEPLHVWIKMFGKKPFASYIAQSSDSDESWLDIPFELEFYYDTEVETDDDEMPVANGLGNYKVLIKLGDTTYGEEPVFEGENPNYFEFGGEKLPFLPFASLFFSIIPGVRQPSGVAEKMMPAQLAVWRGLNRVQNIIDGGPAFYESGAGALSEEERIKFLEAMEAGLVTTEEGKFGQLKAHEALEPPAGLTKYIQDNLSEIQYQSGANPASTGERVQGVKFAAEVNAIQGQSSLTAGTISKDNAEFWERMIRIFLAKGKTYDKKPFSCHVDGAQIDFDTSDPIATYLRPDCEIFVSEDSMRFTPPGQRVALAKDVLATTAQFAPGPGVAIAFQKYLEAAGVDNPEKYLPPPAPAPGAPGTMPGQMNPTMAQEIAS